ncbi:MAG: hypothetical protein AMXMBFR48_22980 [Ignavibacteriales bacterium]
MMRFSILKALAVIMILAGAALNQLVIENFFPGTILFNSWIKSVLLLGIQFVIIATGIYLYTRGMVAVKNLAVLSFGIIVSIVLLELILMFPFTQQLDNPSPLWIPQKYRHLNDYINEQHKKNSGANPYGFNEQAHPLKKPNTLQYRIAVLGDSFVWGAGVEDSIIWTHKLEANLRQEGISIEVMNWGKSGWSTFDQMEFLKNRGLEYEFDYLIFSFVVNDPVMDSSDVLILLGRDGFIHKNILRHLATVFPNSVAFLVDLIQNFTATVFKSGYVDWLDTVVYTEKNLKKYRRLLREIKKFCDDRAIRFAFVMTPESASERMGNYFTTIHEILVGEKITVLNLFPSVREEFGSRNPRSMWANPADGHPGTELTSLYARETFVFLQSELISK